jgi:hypothetical protein
VITPANNNYNQNHEKKQDWELFEFSGGTGKLVISIWFAGTEDKVDEERQIRLGRRLRVSRYSGLPVVLPGLERHMEIEYLQEQLSGPGFTISISADGEYSWDDGSSVSLFAVMGSTAR